MRINYEAFVIDHLNGLKFDAFADVPDGKLVQKPKSFVTVEQTGGYSDGIALGTVTLAVQSWAGSRYEASQLAAEVDAAMFRLVDNTNPVTHVSRSSIYNYPTSQNEPRYQGVYELTVHLF